jgi:predicted nucleotidyltransferase
MTKEDIIQDIQRVLEKYEGEVLFAYLFGSTARSEGGPLAGDIDIAVFLAGGTPEAWSETKLSLYADLCRSLKRNDVDLLILNTAVNLVLLDELVRTGTVVFDRSPDLRSACELDIIHRSLDFKGHRLAVMGV